MRVFLDREQLKQHNLVGKSASSDLPLPATERILQVEKLSVYAQKEKHLQPLVQDVSFTIHRGETLALVGESGSGKSVTASAVMGLTSSALRIRGGSIIFQGEDILQWPMKKRRHLCGQAIGFVFQDYQGSFTPFMKIGKQLIETIRTHRELSVYQSKLLAMEWLDRVDLPAQRVFDSYPFQLSGGQRQRVALAAALMLQPALLIADEPTTALDVLTGEKVLDLMVELQQQTGCAVLFISHDLRQVLKRASRIAVMKGGRIVEIDSTDQIRDHAKHPYTRLLLEACPRLDGIIEPVSKGATL